MSFLRQTELIQQQKLPPFHPGALYALVVLSSSFAYPAFAQTAPVEPPGVPNSAILQMLFGLTLIIAILFAGAYLLRKLNFGKNFGNNGPLKVIGGLMISARERILLIEVGDSWMVVGIVPGQIKTLHTLPKGTLPDTSKDGKPFGLWLKQFSERRNESR